MDGIGATWVLRRLCKSTELISKLYDTINEEYLLKLLTALLKPPKLNMQYYSTSKLVIYSIQTLNLLVYETNKHHIFP